MTSPGDFLSKAMGQESPQEANSPALLRPKSLFVSVGDLSADQHAGKLVSKLKEKAPGLDIWGVGGAAMEAAGARILYDRDAITAFGIIEVIRYIPRLAIVRQDLLNRIVSEKPDAVLLMDFGGFNIGFATLIRKRLKSIPIIYFISPQVWGSRPWRINAIAKAITKMLVIFPFEEALYQRKGVNARFVGHPLTCKFKLEEDRCSKEEFAKQQGLDSEKPIIGIFPGSRKQEITSHAEVVLEAINWLRKERPELQFVISETNQSMADAFQLELERLGYVGLVGTTIKIISSEHNEDLMRHADLLWTKSGTTTLEATFIGKPMLIFYRSSWLTYMIFMIFKTVRYVGWPNLLNGESIVPELIMLDCRAEQLVRYTLDWLDVPGLRKEIGRGLEVLRSHLGEGDFTDKAASEILSVLGLS